MNLAEVLDPNVVDTNNNSGSLPELSPNDMSDPQKILNLEFQVQQYSNFMGLQSSLIKAIKDMAEGIIQRI